MGAFLKPGGRFALLGTTVAPGFECADYESGNRADLIRQCPGQRELILKLT
jgi:predicted cupin superfamily sugar epimerase